ncbi:MAG TPA: hypothetical protein VHF25_01810 [Nitriliruptorales bacterium]|nr:hypothetical protein [Nitriliruptorales bacterium]
MSDEPGLKGPTTSDPVFERAALWPVGLTFLHSHGLTLWGSGGDPEGRDHVLTVEGELVLCANGQVLQAFVAGDTTSSLAGLPGYEHLRAWARTYAGPVEPELAFDYRAVAASLEWRTDRWDRDAAGDLLDAMNMLYDVAAALDEHELLEQFDAGAYGALVDQVTFVEEEEFHTVVRTLDMDGLRRLLGAAVDRIERRVRQVPADATG